MIFQILMYLLWHLKMLVSMYSMEFTIIINSIFFTLPQNFKEDPDIWVKELHILKENQYYNVGNFGNGFAKLKSAK